MKRAMDVILALVVGVLVLPLVIGIAIVVFVQDRHPPFYIGRRVGRSGETFGMVKFRTMIEGADRTGIASTAADDARVTFIGRLLRQSKLDEIPQLFNILCGHMSFVGPRPNVPMEVARYSEVERTLLTVRPGVTDFASIVFADEGEVLEGSADPNRDYNFLIRPWKSRLGLHYVRARSVWLDMELIGLTVVSLLCRGCALRGTTTVLRRTGAPEELIEISRRSGPLVSRAPPGLTEEASEEHLTHK